MIRYTLTCDNAHQFDSWFADAATFAKLQEANRISCAVCNSSRIDKALMAPNIRRDPGPSAPPPESKQLATTNEQERLLAELRQQIETNSEYVGLRFAAEARRIHEGESPERTIHGEASIADAEGLIEDGIRIAPLPFISRRRQN